VSNDTCRI
ncbi:DNA topoisomerase I, partial [Vibrio parahaemolyticus EKP-021]